MSQVDKMKDDMKGTIFADTYGKVLDVPTTHVEAKSKKAEGNMVTAEVMFVSKRGERDMTKEEVDNYYNKFTLRRGYTTRDMKEKRKKVLEQNQLLNKAIKEEHGEVIEIVE